MCQQRVGDMVDACLIAQYRRSDPRSFEVFEIPSIHISHSFLPSHGLSQPGSALRLADAGKSFYIGKGHPIYRTIQLGVGPG